MKLQGILTAQGATRVGTLDIMRLKAYETEAMTRRRESLDFQATHAFVAAFPFYADERAGNVPLYMRGAEYKPANEARLENACRILRKLHPGHHFYASGNGYPLPIVQAGRLAGLGMIGHHGLLIVPDYGSTVTLGAILCDLPLPDGKEAGYCEACGLCIAACPTRALVEQNGERRFIKERCRAFLSQEKELNQEQSAMLSGSPWVSGCDDCQNACPHNRKPRQTILPEFREQLICRVTEESLDNILARRPGERKWKLCGRNLALGAGKGA